MSTEVEKLLKKKIDDIRMYPTEDAETGKTLYVVDVPDLKAVLADIVTHVFEALRR